MSKSLATQAFKEKTPLCDQRDSESCISEYRETVDKFTMTTPVGWSILSVDIPLLEEPNNTSFESTLLFSLFTGTRKTTSK